MIPADVRAKVETLAPPGGGVADAFGRGRNATIAAVLAIFDAHDAAEKAERARRAADLDANPFGY